ncbi:MAG: signal peptide peptidase SppA [Cytophagales bacterium]|nr:signal peptide peptidase SppA [Cytophagales bacterium]
MLQFLKYVLATIIGLFVFSVLLLFILIGIGSAASSEEPVAIEANSVLKLNFDEPIVERAKADPLADLEIPFGPTPSGIGLVQVKRAIANAKLDPNIKGIYVEMNMFLDAGYASLEEIRNALLDFRQSKKFVYAYGEVFSEKAYYLASAADRVYLNPDGALELNGLSSQVPFFKGTFEKLDIKPEIFRVGEFKSAVEPFFLDEMSKASELQTLSYLNSINDHSFGAIAKARGLQVTELKRLADSLLVRQPEDALKYKLVTHVGYYDQVTDDIRQLLKVDKDEEINFVGLGKYSKAEKYVKEGDHNNRVAVIVASGEIRSGDGSDQVIGSDKIAETIREARLDKKVKAIVLRINSPGGSKLASDVMWREVMLARKVKPVIASMSDVAASGGYYMAMGCDTIVAHPNTITGSIGIFGVLFNVQDFLKNKLGVTVDGVKTNAYADLGMPTRPLSAFERQVIQQEVNKGYNDFVKKAAQGRDMTEEQLRNIASGRVWSGAEAKANGLVDVLGGLDDAVRIAARAAKLKDGDYRVRYMPEEETFAEELLKRLNGDQEERILEKQFGILAPYVKQVRDLQYMQGIQARLPYEVQIR